MPDIKLAKATENVLIDSYLRELIGVFEAAFPDRVRSYYLIGSFATGGAIRTSDVDLRVIFKDRFAEGEAARVEQLRDDCHLLGMLPLDLPLRCEEDLLTGEGDLFAIKTASLFLYGTDIRKRLPLPSVADYTRRVTGAAYRNIVLRLRKRKAATYPLEYPDPQNEFYGYAVAGTTQLFVVTIGWAATCAVAMTGQRYVAKKSDWLAHYQEHVGDEWVPFLTAVYDVCRSRWEYEIPKDDEQREALRGLCRAALGFENYYLTLYRAYLLRELGHDDQRSQRFALERLSLVIYPDSEVYHEVMRHTQSLDAKVRTAAEQTLVAIRQAVG